MDPLLWWWRWWLGDDPNRDRQLIEARGLLDEQRSQADELAGQVQARDRELEELRDRATSLERGRAEADEVRTRLTAELDQARSDADEVRARLTAELDQARAETDELRTKVAELDQARAETDELRTKVAELDQARAEADELRTKVAELEADHGSAPDTGTDGPPDVEAAREVLGAKVTADDLTVVEGVGPKIAGLLSDAGIDSWRALADADVERLRLVLAAAGPRYRMHDPSSWPTQGRLLAEGRWQDFKDLAND